MGFEVRGGADVTRRAPRERGSVFGRVRCFDGLDQVDERVEHRAMTVTVGDGASGHEDGADSDSGDGPSAGKDQHNFATFVGHCGFEAEIAAEGLNSQRPYPAGHTNRTADGRGRYEDAIFRKLTGVGE